MRHSICVEPGAYEASPIPRATRRSRMLCTPGGRGMWTTISSIAGAVDVPELPPAPILDPSPPRLDAEDGVGAADLPVKRGLSCRRTWKSLPVGPREVGPDAVAGRLGEGGLGFVAEAVKASSADEPRRSTS